MQGGTPISLRQSFGAASGLGAQKYLAANPLGRMRLISQLIFTLR